MRTRPGLCTGDRKTTKVLTQQLPLKSPVLSSSYWFWYCQNSPPISLQHSLQVSRPGLLRPTLHASSQAASRGTLSLTCFCCEVRDKPCFQRILGNSGAGEAKLPNIYNRDFSKIENSLSPERDKQWGVCRLSMSRKTGTDGLYFVLSRSFTFPWPGFKNRFEVACPRKLTWRSLSTCRDGPCCYDVLWSREGNKSWRSYMPIKWWPSLYKHPEWPDSTKEI